MLNKEKYADELYNLIAEGEVLAVDIKKNTPQACTNQCKNCLFRKNRKKTMNESRREWLNSEYVESKVDWSQIPIDTHILVRDNENHQWTKRYFAGVKDGTVCAWSDGATSWSARDEDDFCKWNYAKLAEDIEN